MRWVVGIDEVGRGPIAGPVSVCVCAVPASLYRGALWKGLTDSKNMTQKNRATWFAKAKDMQREGKMRFAVVHASNNVIDTKGITKAIQTCIDRGLKKIALDPSEVKVFLDGGLKASRDYKRQTTVIRGDSSEKIISFASVVAKETRDAYMQRLHKQHPFYDWKNNKGYGTKAHYRAIAAYGLTTFHRKSFLQK